MQTKKQRKEYVKNNPEVILLTRIKDRCNNPNREDKKWYYDKGIKCLITSQELKELMIRDGYDKMKKPSIDRIKSDKNYTFDNCRFIELKENCGKEYRKSVKQYDLQGNFIREWPSMMEIERQLNISAGDISQVCLRKGNHVSVKGFLWSFSNVPVVIPKYIKIKPILQFDLNKKFIKEYKNASVASRQTNTDISYILDACKKYNHIAKGFIWRFK